MHLRQISIFQAPRKMQYPTVVRSWTELDPDRETAGAVS
jgi:hypothetical protein